ncbi:hypothetical protein J2Z48_001757 [Croceifilum oryzae]|uniref:Uncharacterized protein n=1 Tax=Croceifilum oryzae TaxID=1553429 RepID=A0AAJ1TFJ9_9BACL|nr:hypothetical protein [Croceifilum oryzae]
MFGLRFDVNPWAAVITIAPKPTHLIQSIVRVVAIR